MTHEGETKGSVVAWIAVATIAAALVALLFVITGCADKKITRTIQQVLPVIEHPTCPPHQCWNVDKCGKCEDEP